MDFNDGEVADLLGRLSDAKSPSGFEDEVVDVVRDFCSGWAKVESNTVHDALITPNNFTGNKPVLMLDAHGDEVGGMVKSIRSNGTMTFVELGRFSPNVLAGQDVLVRNTLGEWVHGVIGVKPPHFMSAAERASGELQLILDVGATSKEEAVNVFHMGMGEPFVPATKFEYDEATGSLRRRGVGERHGRGGRAGRARGGHAIQPHGCLHVRRLPCRRHLHYPR